MNKDIKITDFDYYLVKYQLVNLSVEQLSAIYDDALLYQSFLSNVDAVSTVYHDEFPFLNQTIVNKQFSFIIENREKYENPAIREVENDFIRHLNKGVSEFDKEKYLRKEATIRYPTLISNHYYEEDDLLKLVSYDFEYIQLLHTNDLSKLGCDSNFIGTINYMLERTPLIFLDQTFWILFKTLGVVQSSLSTKKLSKEEFDKRFYKRLVRKMRVNMNKFTDSHDEEIMRLLKIHDKKKKKPFSNDHD